MKLKQGNKTYFLGKYKGIVSDWHDPERRGRVKIKCPGIWGIYESPWALPSVPSGTFMIPKEGTGVWVECEQGDPQYPIYTGRWFGGRDGSSEIPEEGKQTCSEVICSTCGDQADHQNDPEHLLWHSHPDWYCPKTRMIFSDTGHKIIMSDKGDGNFLKIIDAKGQEIEMNCGSSGKERITWKDAHGNKIESNEKGIEWKDVYENKISSQSGKVEIETTGKTEIRASGEIVLKGNEPGRPVSGIVTQLCNCAFTGAPHPVVSLKVKAQ